MKKKVFRWIKIILILYGLIGIAIYYLQDYMLFSAVALPRNHVYNFKEPHKEIDIPFDSVSNISVVEFTSNQPAKGVVLYFHGNKTNISRYQRFVPYFTKHGYEVWMIDYPGYGKSTGLMNEQRLYDYAGQLYKLARARFPKDSIIIYGKSLGTGIAAWLASRKDCKQLILETPYYSLPSLASHFLPIYPMERMMHYKIPTCEYIPRIIAPITIFHGTSDGIIPYSNCRRLQPLLKPTDKFITIEGGSHRDLFTFPFFREKLDSLLDK
jgi:alpha-beta hydrolase superfamily lysophospholipase